MKKVIERMNAGVIEEQRKAMGSAPAPSKDTSAANASSKRKWFGGALKKVTGATKDTPAETGPSTPTEPADDGDGMRVDFYLVVFLKFIASIVPTIEVDSTTAF